MCIYLTFIVLFPISLVLVVFSIIISLFFLSLLMIVMKWALTMFGCHMFVLLDSVIRRDV